MQKSDSTGTMNEPRYDGQMSKDPEQYGAHETDGAMAATKEKLAEGADFGKQKLADGADMGMDRAAEGMESAAEALRDRVGGDGVVAKAGSKAADQMETAASYLREHDSQELWTDVQEYVRQHPATALVGALAAGYLLSRVVR